jgi:hypothetical protein
MNNYHLIQQLQTDISSTGADIKAEQYLAQAMEEGLTYDDFMVSCDSLFYRAHNKDIVYSDIKEDARKLPLLQLHVSRSGLFDHLPEGLFFEPAASQQKNNGAAAMAAEYRINQEKEAAARRLFLPFENDFFWQRLQLEVEETALLQNLQAAVLKDLFLQFGGTTASLPLLPYAHTITGNLSLTAQCLEALLREPVQVTMTSAPPTKADAFDQVLGKQQLAIDMVCGDQFMEDHPVIKCTIGPLQHTELTDYLPGGCRMHLLHTLYSFFVPAEATVITQIEPSKATNGMVLRKEDAVLGYATLGVVA